MKRGDDAENDQCQPGADRCRRRNRQVHRRRELNGEAGREPKLAAEHACHEKARNGEGAGAPRQRQEARLDELRADEPPARRAERQPHRGLVPSRRAARQHEIRHVRAGDEQDQGDSHHDRCRERPGQPIYAFVHLHAGRRQERPRA